MRSLEELLELYWTREKRPLSIRVRRSNESADAAAFIERLYYSARSIIEGVATARGDGQVTTDYISGVRDGLVTGSNDTGDTVLTFEFKDYGTMCPMASRACRHWFELAFTQIDLADCAKDAGFELAEKFPPLAEILVTPSPLVYLRGALVACEQKADGTVQFIVDHGYEVPDWGKLSSKDRKMIAGLIEQKKCGCSVCKALQ